jgi:uncharacterized protein YecE (DUF72 family)
MTGRRGHDQAGHRSARDAEKLGPLLCQFPASFKRDDASVDYLTRLLETFVDYRLAVELRHRAWPDECGPRNAPRRRGKLDRQR